jgi:hypothetical protein
MAVGFLVAVVVFRQPANAQLNASSGAQRHQRRRIDARRIDSRRAGCDRTGSKADSFTLE